MRLKVYGREDEPCRRCGSLIGRPCDRWPIVLLVSCVPEIAAEFPGRGLEAERGR